MPRPSSTLLPEQTHAGVHTHTRPCGRGVSNRTGDTRARRHVHASHLLPLWPSVSVAAAPGLPAVIETVGADGDGAHQHSSSQGNETGTLHVLSAPLNVTALTPTDNVNKALATAV